MSEVFKYATHRDIKKGMKWGKVIEKVKVTNLFDLKKSIEVEAVIDTGATMLVLPQNIINDLSFRV